MAYFSAKSFPLVSMFNKLSPGERRSVIETGRKSGVGSAARLVRIFGQYDQASSRFYELPQPATEAIEDVRMLIGDKAASIVEAALAGDTNSIAELDADDQRYARNLVGRHGLELP